MFRKSENAAGVPATKAVKKDGHLQTKPCHHVSRMATPWPSIGEQNEKFNCLSEALTPSTNTGWPWYQMRLSSNIMAHLKYPTVLRSVAVLLSPPRIDGWTKNSTTTLPCVTSRTLGQSFREACIEKFLDTGMCCNSCLVVLCCVPLWLISAVIMRITPMTSPSFPAQAQWWLPRAHPRSGEDNDNSFETASRTCSSSLCHAFHEEMPKMVDVFGHGDLKDCYTKCIA